MIVFINRFTVSADPHEFERVFTETADHLTKRPGFIRYRLLRAADDPRSYANIAEWETEDDLRAAVLHPEFDEHVKALRELARSEPKFYEVVAECGRTEA